MTNPAIGPKPTLRIRADLDEEIDEQELRSIIGAFMQAVNDREEPPGMQEVISAAWTIIGRAVQRIECAGCRQLQIDALGHDLTSLVTFIERGTEGGTEHVH